MTRPIFKIIKRVFRPFIFLFTIYCCTCVDAGNALALSIICTGSSVAEYLSPVMGVYAYPSKRHLNKKTDVMLDFLQEVLTDKFMDCEWLLLRPDCSIALTLAQKLGYLFLLMYNATG